VKRSILLARLEELRLKCVEQEIIEAVIGDRNAAMIWREWREALLTVIPIARQAAEP
jgi:hypothetical protein